MPASAEAEEQGTPQSAGGRLCYRLWRWCFPSRTSRQRLGHRAERAAARWLRRHAGLKVLRRNWRHGKGELDLICQQGQQQIVFVEVRARSEEALVDGYHSISAAKKDLLRKTCLAYLRTLKRRARQSWRFDIVSVRVGEHGRFEIRHYERVKL